MGALQRGHAHAHWPSGYMGIYGGKVKGVETGAGPTFLYTNEVSSIKFKLNHLLRRKFEIWFTFHIFLLSIE